MDFKDKLKQDIDKLTPSEAPLIKAEAQLSAIKAEKTHHPAPRRLAVVLSILAIVILTVIMLVVGLRRDKFTDRFNKGNESIYPLGFSLSAQEYQDYVNTIPRPVWQENYYIEKFIFFEDIFPGHEALFRSVWLGEATNLYKYTVDAGSFGINTFVYCCGAEDKISWMQLLNTPTIAPNVEEAIADDDNRQAVAFKNGRRYTTYATNKVVRIDDIDVIYRRYYPDDLAIDYLMVLFTIDDVTIQIYGHVEDMLSSPATQEYLTTETMRAVVQRLKETIPLRTENFALPEE